MFIDILNQPWIAIDLETDDPYLKTHGPGVRTGAYIVGVAIATPEQQVYYPVAHTRGNNTQILAYLRGVCKEYTGEIIGANLLYDLDFLAERNILFKKAKFVDVLVAEPLLDENQFEYNLNSLSIKYLNETKRYDHMEAKYGKGWIRNIKECSVEDTAIYAIGDVDLPVKIWEKQKHQLVSEELYDLCQLEFKLIPMLLYMRRIGCPVDLNKANKLHDIYQERIDTTQQKLNNIAGKIVNTKSGKDLADLFDSLGMSYPTTAKGNPSFLSGWLNTVDNDIVRDIRTINKYRHAQSTFVENYILEKNIDGRLHCEFNQAKGDGKGTVSGRFSSSNPNLQNIPSRDDDKFHIGSEIRSLFVPEEGCVWWSRDYSQIEYRLFVHYAGISNQPEAYRAVDRYNSEEGVDFHKMVQEWVVLDRPRTKTINFGILYGMGVSALATGLNCSVEDAKVLLKKYDSHIPFAKSLAKDVTKIAGSRGFIRTILGRKRRFDRWEPGGYSKNKSIMANSREEAMAFVGDPTNKDWYGKTITRAFTYKGLNALLQGSAADIMKKAMVDIWDKNLTDYLDIYLTVHDELDGSVDLNKAGAREALEELTRTMEDAVKLCIPVYAEGKEASNWSEAK